ncbi:MAG: PEP/pyruvate-binding domain-containing protein [Acidimicrobiia bacterium]|nr:PEP/pyruvate-binding domain-containing protein [Acidimicrobiia bacterium]
MTREGAHGGYGGKAGNTQWLIANGERVPETWVIAPELSTDDLSGAVATALDPSIRYAVRSSASVEDGTAMSYAGQFATELDVSADSVLAAVSTVRDSVNSDRVVAYREQLGADDGLAMFVMVQPMVWAVASGVAFSRNPMTGLNEVVVEAVAGRGDQLVGEGITPDRWIHRWGSWTEEPADGAIDNATAESIVEHTRRIAADYGAPVDLEWVWDGTDVSWVQLRPITGLDRVSIYSNRISREVMPGIIKPLVWSVNVPMVNRAWVDLFTEAIGQNTIEPESLAKAFAYRSYFNMGAIGDIFELLGMPRDSLELLLGLPAGSDQPSFKPTMATMRRMPRMLTMAAKKARYGKTVEQEVDALRTAFAPFATAELSGRSDSALLDDVRALSLLGERAAYANIVTPLLANLYNALLRKRLTKAGLDPEAVAVADTADLEDVNPNVHLDRLTARFWELDEAGIEALRTGGYAALPDELRRETDEFLDRFGHLSASGNDFSVPPWRETPDDVVQMVLDHVPTHGAAERIEWGVAEQRLGAAMRPVLRNLRNRTREHVSHRESVSFIYTYGYGLFRRYFMEIGRRLVDRGVLAKPDHVMYLYLDEARAALLETPMEIAPRDLVAARMEEIDALTDVAMPEVIYGDDFVPTRGDVASGTLRGIPSSRGHHQGTVRVVRDTGDFGKVEPGDVIAIPYSDVGWTPLFARAGAVVAEAGGMLSHSSIVAREYRIPCVVSVEGATRLPDGATVTVDGYAGTVVVEEQG